MARPAYALVILVVTLLVGPLLVFSPAQATRPLPDMDQNVSVNDTREYWLNRTHEKPVVGEICTPRPVEDIFCFGPVEPIIHTKPTTGFLYRVNTTVGAGHNSSRSQEYGPYTIFTSWIVFNDVPVCANKCSLPRSFYVYWNASASLDVYFFQTPLVDQDIEWNDTVEQPMLPLPPPRRIP